MFCDKYEVEVHVVLVTKAPQGTLAVPGFLVEVGSLVVVDALDGLVVLVEVDVPVIEDALEVVEALEEVLGEVEELEEASCSFLLELLS